MSDIAVKVRLAVREPAEVARLTTALEQHGLRVRQRLPQLGLVTGDVAVARVDALRSIPGVEAVEAEGGVQLPPFDPRRPQ